MTPDAEIQQAQAKRVSVVIVSFNRVDSLRRSLASLGESHQVLVVDNGSKDGSAELDAEFPSVRFIRLPKNFGLTKALNIGLRAAEGEYVLFLHDDTRIEEAAVSRLADLLESRQDVGAVCPLLVDGSGARVPQVRALPTPSDPDPPLKPAQDGNEIAAECVSGAAIMFRLFFLRALRNIDERYGNYGSIIELCWQVRRAGRKLLIMPDVTAVHEGTASPMKEAAIEGDRTVGTAVFLGTHHGFARGILYRVKSALMGLITFRVKVVAGALSGVKIDGS